MPEYVIEGQCVTCTEGDQRRWHCDCPEYERRLVKFGEGFCEHLVLAISREFGCGRLWADFPPASRFPIGHRE
jgi:hypothetical protein